MKKKTIFVLAFIGLTTLLYGQNASDFVVAGNVLESYKGAARAVTIPTNMGITEIGVQAFWSTNITSVVIPAGVTIIRDSAFSFCQSLTSIIIPNSVTTIEQDAFLQCRSLASINIPASVTTIGKYAFHSCTKLNGITVDEQNTTYSSIDGVLFNKAKNTIILYPNGKQGMTYTIPAGVTTIGDYAFYRCEKLTSIIIPNSVTSIGNLAFSDCEKLTSIIIPNSVTSIGERIFNWCESLTSINIPSSVTTIGVDAFGAKSIAVITVDEQNTFYSSVDGVLFNKARTTIIKYPTGKQGRTYTIPASVTTIGVYAFSGCSLANINIPNNVTSIGSYAFDGCTGLTSVTIPNGIKSIEEHAFYNCKSLPSIIIPNSVNSIGNSAFYSCSSLTSVNIPTSVTAIGNAAFKECSRLTSVTFQSNRISIDTGFLSQVPFPGDLFNKYLAGGIGTYTRAANGNTWTKQ